MTEDDAKTWLRDELAVSGAAFERLNAFRQMVIEENERQNLVSKASITHFWVRHIVDSAQLLGFAPVGGSWLDLGTGAGFPGVVIALLRDAPITFVESRRKRSDFLAESVEKLGLSNAQVYAGELEKFKSAPFSIISARAFAPLHRLLPVAHSLSTTATTWLLPKGRSAREEIGSIDADWTGMFHVKQSLTDADASIIVAEQVAQRKRT